MSGQGRARILLVDDHAMVRSGLRALIDATPDLEVVGEAGDGAEAIRQTQELAPDVVLLDLGLPGTSGLVVLRELRKLAPRTRVLVLTMYDDEAYLQQVLKLGGAGYLVKRAADLELLLALRAVVKGEVYVHSSLTRTLVGRAVKGVELEAKGQRTDQQLSTRERTLVRLVARGHTNQQMADQLLLSVKTIEVHRARLMEKLALRSRADLVRYAMKAGLFGLEE